MSSEKMKKIENLEILRSQRLKEILRIQAMLPGSFNTVYCRCGKKNCWCYGEGKRKDKVGHPFKRITWTEKGKSRTKAIPEKDVDWIKSVTENYRIFRKKRREIQRLEESIRNLLDDYRMGIVKKTRKLRKYL